MSRIRRGKKRITKRKYPKAIQKRKNRKKLGHMVAPVHFDPKILPKGSAAAMGGAGARDLIFHRLCGPVERKKP